MSKKTRALTLAALLIALTEVFLFAAAMIPTSRIAVIAIAGLMTAAAVIEAGLMTGAAVFIGSSILALLILPLKSAALLYILFFGLYPLLKSLFEKIKSRPLEWLFKVLYFNIALTALYLLWRYGFMGGVELGFNSAALLYAGGNFCFVMYDIAFSRLVQLYLARIYKKR